MDFYKVTGKLCIYLEDKGSETKHIQPWSVCHNFIYEEEQEGKKGIKISPNVNTFFSYLKDVLVC